MVTLTLSCGLKRPPKLAVILSSCAWRDTTMAPSSTGSSEGSWHREVILQEQEKEASPAMVTHLR